MIHGPAIFNISHGAEGLKVSVLLQKVESPATLLLGFPEETKSVYCIFHTKCHGLVFSGVLLHYDDATLKDLYFLDPQWLCDMLAHVVTIREINPFARTGEHKMEMKIFHFLCRIFTW
jgi:hypothetical protein